MEPTGGSSLQRQVSSGTHIDAKIILANPTEENIEVAVQELTPKEEHEIHKAQHQFEHELKAEKKAQLVEASEPEAASDIATESPNETEATSKPEAATDKAELPKEKTSNAFVRHFLRNRVSYLTTGGIIASVGLIAAGGLVALTGVGLVLAGIVLIISLMVASVHHPGIAYGSAPAGTLAFLLPGLVTGFIGAGGIAAGVTLFNKSTNYQRTNKQMLEGIKERLPDQTEFETFKQEWLHAKDRSSCWYKKRAELDRKDLNAGNLPDLTKEDLDLIDAKLASVSPNEANAWRQDALFFRRNFKKVCDEVLGTEAKPMNFIEARKAVLEAYALKIDSLKENSIPLKDSISNLTPFIQDESRSIYTRLALSQFILAGLNQDWNKHYGSNEEKLMGSFASRVGDKIVKTAIGNIRQRILPKDSGI